MKMSREMSKLRLAPLLACAAVAAGLGACATSGQDAAGQGANMVTDAVQQPFRDLNLIREETPALLQEAAATPYPGASVATCEQLEARIRSLDEVLGPDLDKKIDDDQSHAIELANGALRGALDLPLSGLVRRVSGAHNYEEEARRAVLAGMVRRAYLKGVAEERGCFDPDPVTLSAPELLPDHETAGLDDF